MHSCRAPAWQTHAPDLLEPTQAGDPHRERSAQIRIRAETRTGELPREREKAKGTRGQLNGKDRSGGRRVKPPEHTAKTLKQLGISDEAGLAELALIQILEIFKLFISTPALFVADKWAVQIHSLSGESP